MHVCKALYAVGVSFVFLVLGTKPGPYVLLPNYTPSFGDILLFRKDIWFLLLGKFQAFENSRDENI